MVVIIKKMVKTKGSPIGVKIFNAIYSHNDYAHEQIKGFELLNNLYTSPKYPKILNEDFGK